MENIKEKDLPSVSLVVPFYNAARHIKGCIESIMALDYPVNKVEVVFVDNRSTDNGPSIVSAYGNKIKMVRESKRGPAAARNAGIRASSYPILAFTDSDARVDKLWLKNLVAPFVEETGIGVTGGRILSVEPSNPIARYGDTVHDHQKAIEYYKPPYLIGMNIAVRKECLEKAGLFDEDFIASEDSELGLRLYMAGCLFRYVSDAVIFHINETTLSGLFREGFGHGFWGVKKIKKYSGTFFKGRPIVYFEFLTRPLRLFFEYLTGLVFPAKKNPEALYASVFNAGKVLGKICGSVRFRFLSI